MIWWKELPGVTGGGTENDICDDCGHIRNLHGIGGCHVVTGRTRSPRPCSCVQSCDGPRWRAPRWLQRFLA